MSKLLSRFSKYIGSNKFYRLIIGFFIFEALWIAISAAYPQAFDENYHFGLIQVFSHYWLPFLSRQPPHADAYSTVARDPSYLYPYLLSFPYRLIELFTKHQMTQVIILRIINVGFFTYGLVLFRKVLLKAKASKALANLILMLFILIPIVPQLAGQVNYDCLMFMLSAAMLLLTFRIIDEFRNHQPSLFSLALFVGGGLLTSLVMYAFLPLLAGMVLFLAIVIYQQYAHRLKQFAIDLAKTWGIQTKLAKIVIIFLLIVPTGMFIAQDGVNLVVYHTIAPSCSSVLTIKQCKAYSPWAYNYKQHNIVLSKGASLKFTNPVVYVFQWVYWMWYRLFFAVNGLNSNFKNYPPLPLPSAAALVLLIIGVFALIKWWRKVFFGNPYIVLLAVVTICYIVALIGQGYITYKYTAVLENMNGRYLIPILMLAAVIFGEAISWSFKKSQKRKAILAVVALVLFLEGGGLLTFIARSDPSWDQENKTIVKINNIARKVIKPVVVKGKKSYHTSIWFFN